MSGSTTNLLGLPDQQLASMYPSGMGRALPPPGNPGADPGMVAQPYADPGYAMPNAFVGNLNQAPGQTIGGTLRAGGMYPTDMGYMPPGSARVVPDKMYDVPPILDMGNVNIADPQARQLSAQEQQWWDMLDALKRAGASQDVIDYHMSQNPQVRVSDRWAQEGQRAPQDADAIMRAITTLQRPKRNR